jgi:hypothetical protein
VVFGALQCEEQAMKDTWSNINLPLPTMNRMKKHGKHPCWLKIQILLTYFKKPIV